CRALPRLGLGDGTGAFLELLPLALEDGEHALERTRIIAPGPSPPQPSVLQSAPSQPGWPHRFLQLAGQTLHLPLALGSASRRFAKRRLELQDLLGGGGADPVALGPEPLFELPQPRKLGADLRRMLRP